MYKLDFKIRIEVLVRVARQKHEVIIQSGIEANIR